MRAALKYFITALLAALITHCAVIEATPRVLMEVAFKRLSAGGTNMWRVGEQVTPMSRTIVRPSPDFAYSACAYDLSRGPLTINTSPWRAYWSLSLYAANSDNYLVVDDREAHDGAAIVLVRRGHIPPDAAARVVESPSERGIALIRRLAPTSEDYAAARRVAEADVCGPYSAGAQ